MATSAEVNPNDGSLGREFPHNALNSRLGCFVLCPDQSCIKVPLNFGNKLILEGPVSIYFNKFILQQKPTILEQAYDIIESVNVRISQQVGCGRQKQLEFPIFMLSNVMAMNLELLQNS